MSDWQPIETAPKDGRSVLVANERASWEAHWLEGAWYEANNDPTDAWGRPAYDGELLGWMPMPNPPSVELATPPNAGATPTDTPQAVGAQQSSSSSLLSPVEGRHDKPEHVCGLSGFCPAPPHWDECPACNSKETK
jgi:hypothetical protein